MRPGLAAEHLDGPLCLPSTPGRADELPAGR